FQAEDGIRDFHVTGVQTCALPISGHVLAGTDVAKRRPRRRHPPPTLRVPAANGSRERTDAIFAMVCKSCKGDVGGRARDARRPRSEERRVGKECGWGWLAEGYRRK